MRHIIHRVHHPHVPHVQKATRERTKTTPQGLSGTRCPEEGAGKEVAGCGRQMG